MILEVVEALLACGRAVGSGIGVAMITVAVAGGGAGEDPIAAVVVGCIKGAAGDPERGPETLLPADVTDGCTTEVVGCMLADGWAETGIGEMEEAWELARVSVATVDEDCWGSLAKAPGIPPTESLSNPMSGIRIGSGDADADDDADDGGLEAGWRPGGWDRVGR